MILGSITGKVTTKQFTFIVDEKAKVFEYVQVSHVDAGFVLCQIVELIRDEKQMIARCQVIGYKSDSGKIVSLREPFEVGEKVLRAQDDFIRDIIKLQQDKGALIGKLDGRDIPIFLDLQTLLTKHLAVLAKSGAGKSYCVGVLLEEIMEKNVPLLIIDPHGEYSSLKQKNDNEEDIARLGQYKLKPKSFLKRVVAYGDVEQESHVRPLLIPEQLTAQELVDILPSKLSAAQEGLLYSAIKQMTHFDFDALINALEQEESPGKWNVIKMIDYLRSFNIFSKSPIAYNELVQGGRCSILHLKGIHPDMQGIIVYKLLKDLFEERKKGRIPPFFCVIEEAHNYCPERSFGQSTASSIIRTIASEGRKFGMGLAIISQRPARVDKSVLSQVSTQIILKVTNPNDLKAISNSVEGITSDSEREIQNLAIGQALITGVVDVPLFVDVRPRMTKHGGGSIDMLTQKDEDFFETVKEFEKKDLLPLVKPHISLQDYCMMHDVTKEQVDVLLIPGAMFLCESSGNEFHLLLERHGGHIVKDVDTFTLGKIPEFEKLNKQELLVLKKAHSKKKFVAEDLAEFGLDVSLVLDRLVSIGYMSKAGKQYFMNESYIFSNLKKYAIYQKIEFASPVITRKVESKASLDTLKRTVSKFVTIKDLRDCHILAYSHSS
ncbi:MAG: DNA helicase HerA-like ATPase [Candidatus Woesearchaeota archaeon]|jgi:DNA helicase HerA-like ATPase